MGGRCSRNRQKKVIVCMTSLGVNRKEFNDSKRLMRLLDTLDIQYDLIDLNDLELERAKELRSETSSIPSLFVEDEELGGFDKIQQMHDFNEFKKTVKKRWWKR